MSVKKCYLIVLVSFLSAGCATSPKQEAEKAPFAQGLFYIEQGKLEDAERAFAGDAQLDPESLRIIREMLQRGECPRDPEIARQIRTQPRLGQVCDRLLQFNAARYEEKHEYRPAIHAYNQMLDMNPYYQTALLGMIRCYEKLGEFKKADAVRRYCDASPKPELGVRDEDNRFYKDDHIAYELIVPESRRRLWEVREEIQETNGVNDLIMEVMPKIQY